PCLRQRLLYHPGRVTQRHKAAEQNRKRRHYSQGGSGSFCSSLPLRAADDPRSHTKRHNTRPFFVQCRVISWTVFFALSKELALSLKLHQYPQGSLSLWERGKHLWTKS